MTQWNNFFKIVSPPSQKQRYALINDAVNMNTHGYPMFAANAMFTNIMRGAIGRLQRYRQYDNMDTGDVARALDIVAEEISNGDSRTNLPFIIDYQIEENVNLDDNVVITIRTALRQWCNLHGLNQKMFDIARKLVKYGDCFFRKTSDTKKWEYVDPTRVVGIEVAPDGTKLAYHIKPSNFAANAYPGDNLELERSPADAVIHFTLSNEMGEYAPFGMSILQPAYSDWQKLVMLEQASIIYRIVRAPERRVFYLDVGNTPPPKVKAYLEEAKNAIRQKRIPNSSDANQTDGVLNTESIQEDYFFPVTAAGRSSRVETLPSGTSWEIPELDYFLNKVFRALRVPTSYMRGSDGQGGQVTDGKVGIAYIEERRFANFIMRLQNSIQEVCDAQFKTYVNVTGIKVDQSLFFLKLPDPQNFELYQKAALDADLINSFNSIEGTKYLSKRFMLRRYLGLTDDEIQMNEALVKQERNIKDGTVDELQQLYDPEAFDNRNPVEIPDETADIDVASGAANSPADTDLLDDKPIDK